MTSSALAWFIMNEEMVIVVAARNDNYLNELPNLVIIDFLKMS